MKQTMLTTISMGFALLFLSCSSTFQAENKLVNPAYSNQITKLELPPLTGQFVLLNPEILSQELQIANDLDSIMQNLFLASLLSHDPNSTVKIEPTPDVLLVEDEVFNPEIRPGFFIKAYLPSQKLNLKASETPLLVIHDWYLGYGITANSFYDRTEAQLETDPESAKTLGSVMSYSVWDQQKAQIIQSGVVEANIPRVKNWKTEDFKLLGSKISKLLTTQINGTSGANK